MIETKDYRETIDAPRVKEKYNGYTNYPTWVVKLHLDNEEPLYRWVQEKKLECDSVYEMEHLIKNEIEYYSAEIGTAFGVMRDLNTWAMEQVNYREIAEMIMEED